MPTRVSPAAAGPHRPPNLPGTGMRLHIGVLCAESALARSMASRSISSIFASAVIPPPGIALGVLVGQATAHGGHHRRGGDVFRGDETQYSPAAADTPAAATWTPPHPPGPDSPCFPSKNSPWCCLSYAVFPVQYFAASPLPENQRFFRQCSFHMRPLITHEEHRHGAPCLRESR